MLLKQKAPKQNPAPINVVTERSWKKVQGILVAKAGEKNWHDDCT